MIEQFVEALKATFAGITPEMVLEWLLEVVKAIPMVISPLIVVAAIPVALIMIVHSIIIFALQCAFSGPRLSRFITLSTIVSYAIGVSSIYGMAIGSDIGRQIANGIDGLIHIINGERGDLTLAFCIVAGIMLFVTLFAFIEAVKTVFSKRRVIAAYDEDRIGKAVIAHRVHFMLYVIILIAAVVYLVCFSNLIDLV